MRKLSPCLSNKIEDGTCGVLGRVLLIEMVMVVIMFKCGPTTPSRLTKWELFEIDRHAKRDEFTLPIYYYIRAEIVVEIHTILYNL